ncbi:hypothetical protein CEXT_208151 [Caerostris extrusa]|uniref:Uncharacterized protein n=1 Tax=Caerostris extrusa TaxID=172846 RepID=A0AAV4RZ88_CAEEX|nr:hypothetical protein CEXT_208151 [Caerostris extrusa]
MLNIIHINSKLTNKNILSFKETQSTTSLFPKSISTGNTNVSTTTHSLLFGSRLKSTPDSLRKLPRGSNAIYYYLPDNVSPVTSAGDTAAALLCPAGKKKPNLCRGKKNHCIGDLWTAAKLTISLESDTHSPLLI